MHGVSPLHAEEVLVARVRHAEWCECWPCTAHRELLAYREEISGRTKAANEVVPRPNYWGARPKPGTAKALEWRYGPRRKSR